tara:strand:+ start:315 stop:536 length:222 start_codon:yes stop_codon:yes gene_type:complete
MKQKYRYKVYETMTYDELAYKNVYTIIHYVVANNEEHAIQKAKSLDCQADTRGQYGSDFKAELNPVLYREEKE